MKIGSRALPVFAAGLVMLVLALPQAVATHSEFTDLPDSRGALDVRRIGMKGGEEPRFIISTYDTWTIAAIRDNGFLLVGFDTFGTTHRDYYALIRSTGDRLVGSLWRDHLNRNDVRLRTLRVSRPSLVTVRVRVPLRRLNFGINTVYTWSVTTLWTGPHCRRVCIDRAPHTGGITEPAPGRFSPSPTPSFTIVPTESPSPSPSPEPSQTLVPSPTPTQT